LIDDQRGGYNGLGLPGPDPPAAGRLESAATDLAVGYWVPCRLSIQGLQIGTCPDGSTNNTQDTFY